MKTLALITILVLSGTVKDKGYNLVDGQIVTQTDSQLIVTVDQNLVTVKAK